MDYKWSVTSKLEVVRERPAMRYVVTSLGGYFPVMQKLQDGRLAVVARDGDFHVGQRGRLILVTSRDGGESWSPPTVVAGEGLDNRNPSFGQAPDGTLLVAFHKQSSYVSGRYTPGRSPIDWTEPFHYITRSQDGGATWSEAEALSFPAGRFSPYGKMITLADGTMVISFYGRQRAGDGLDKPMGTYVIRSRDGGRTWGDVSTVATGDQNYNETALLALPSGRLLAAVRCEYPGYPEVRVGADLWLSISDDGGYTWSELRRLTGHDEHPADLMLLRSGKVLMTYGQRNPPYGVRAMVSHNGGETWDQEHKITLVADGATRDLGYPSSVQLDDGKIVTAYYAYESFSPFSYLNRPTVGIHAAAVKYDEADLP